MTDAGEGADLPRGEAMGDRYTRLVAAGMIRPAGLPFDVSHLPEPVPNLTGRDSLDWLAEQRRER